MSEWRPGDWKNPYSDVEFADWAESLWEAGADAMLTALRERAFIILPEGTLIHPTRFQTEGGCADGCLVFLPNSPNSDWPLAEQIEWVEGDSSFVASRRETNSGAGKRLAEKC